ncbi:MAG: RES family NAD+ phosphorylase [Sedimenticola sp.]
MHDIRDGIYEYLHDPDDWSPSQAFGSDMKARGSWGLVYRSVRHPGGECIAALPPPPAPRTGSASFLCMERNREISSF